MNIETLHIGMKVRHPQYGVGTVRSLTEQTAEIAFDDALRKIAPASSDLQPAELDGYFERVRNAASETDHYTAHAVVEALGLEQKDALVEGLASPMAARDAAHAACGRFASAERSSAGDFLPQDCQ